MTFKVTKEIIGKAPCYRDPEDGSWNVGYEAMNSPSCKTVMKNVYLEQDPAYVLNAVPDCELVLGYPWIALAVLDEIDMSEFPKTICKRKFKGQIRSLVADIEKDGNDLELVIMDSLIDEKTILYRWPVTTQDEVYYLINIIKEYS